MNTRETKKISRPPVSKGSKCSKGSKGSQNRKRNNSESTTSPLTVEYPRKTRKSNQYFGRQAETQYSAIEGRTPPSRSTMSSLTGYSTGSDRTETDPGEFYEKWKLRDDKSYDTDETYLTPPGSKYTSCHNRYVIIGR